MKSPVTRIAVLLALTGCPATPDDVPPTTEPGTSAPPEPATTDEPDPATTAAPTTTEPDPTTTTSDSSTGAAEPVAADLTFGCVADQPTVTLRLLLADATCGADWPDLSLKVSLFGLTSLAPGTYPLGPGLGLALLIDDGAPDPTVVGSVTIEALTADAVHGSYLLEFSDHGPLAGSFAGPLCGPPLRC